MAHGFDMQRFTAILEAYGNEPSRWPDGEREEMLQFIAANPQTETPLTAATELDRLLDSSEIDAPSKALHGAILASLAKPAQGELIDALLAWLFPASSRHLAWLWRPAVAVTLPVAVGFLLGAGSVGYAGSDDWESWEEEIYITGIVTVDVATPSVEIEP
jgi:hypothetical protein|tara:strand:- start:604 stop:1083 length:480 start_codon:yes stop_codon:yes gene_type:complete